jgi:hypothetical protein
VAQSEYLLHSPARICRKLLVDLGLAGDAVPPWPAFVANEPDAPDEAITVYDSPEGKSDGRSMIDGELWTHPAVTFRVRAASDAAGRPKAAALREAIRQVWRRQVVVSGTAYVIHAFTGVGQVLSLGHEQPEGKRYVFNVNSALTLWRII